MKGGYSSSSRELTPRMREALAGAAAGETAKRTADRLHVAEPTVRTILANARGRLGAGNTREAIAIAVRDGLL
jgi:DNA-binding CsgD family transcriptional regulator